MLFTGCGHGGLASFVTNWPLTGLWRMIGSYVYRTIVNVLAMSGQTHERKNVTEMTQIYSDFVLN